MTNSTPRVWYTLFLLFIVNFLNFFDRSIPAVVFEPIRKEFSLDDTQLGILATAFTIIYAVAGIPLGRLSDKYRRTRILGAGVFVWSLLTGASALAWNVLGGGLGTVVAGALSDFYAKKAMVAAGSAEMTGAFRAVGIQTSMSLVVPLAILVTAIALFFAGRTFVADAEKMKLAGHAAAAR